MYTVCCQSTIQPFTNIFRNANSRGKDYQKLNYSSLRHCRRRTNPLAPSRYSVRPSPLRHRFPLITWAWASTAFVCGATAEHVICRTDIFSCHLHTHRKICVSYFGASDANGRGWGLYMVLLEKRNKMSEWLISQSTKHTSSHFDSAKESEVSECSRPVHPFRSVPFGHMRVSGVRNVPFGEYPTYSVHITWLTCRNGYVLLRQFSSSQFSKNCETHTAVATIATVGPTCYYYCYYVIICNFFLLLSSFSFSHHFNGA